VLFGRTVTMLGFNGQYPGPLIEVTEASTIVIRFTNRTGFRPRCTGTASGSTTASTARRM
jgi:FtsP/CotA-like multicopper oxidase with cupredoxin domain